MPHVYIPETCSQKWENMQATALGAHCQSCSMEVIDFTTKSAEEIKHILAKRSGSHLCGRIQNSQLQSLNADIDRWLLNREQHMRAASFLVLIAIFGLGLFSCNSPEAENAIEQWQRNVQSFELAEKKTPETILEPVREVALVQQLAGPHYLISEDYACKLQQKEESYMAEMIAPAEQQIDRDYVMMGAMVSRVQIGELYRTIETNEDTPVYDRNGVLIPTEYGDKVYPNPTNGPAMYELQLPHDGLFVIGLYSMDGRHIRNLYEGDLERGTHSFPLYVEDELPGTFLVVTRSKNFSNTQRLIKM